MISISIHAGQQDAAYIVAVGAAADLFSRLFLAVVSFFIPVKARHIYLVGATVPIFLRFGMPSVGNKHARERILNNHDFFSVLHRKWFYWNGCDHSGTRILSNICTCTYPPGGRRVLATRKVISNGHEYILRRNFNCTRISFFQICFGLWTLLFFPGCIRFFDEPNRWFVNFVFYICSQFIFFSFSKYDLYFLNSRLDSRYHA